MATEVSDTPSVPRENAFHRSPACPEGMMLVRPGADPVIAGLAGRIILCWLRERNEQLTGGDDACQDEPWVHNLLVDMAIALNDAAEVRA